jgi:hypothetical protein
MGVLVNISFFSSGRGITFSDSAGIWAHLPSNNQKCSPPPLTLLSHHQRNTLLQTALIAPATPFKTANKDTWRRLHRLCCNWELPWPATNTVTPAIVREELDFWRQPPFSSIIGPKTYLCWRSYSSLNSFTTNRQCVHGSKWRSSWQYTAAILLVVICEIRYWNKMLPLKIDVLILCCWWITYITYYDTCENIIVKYIGQ